MSISNKTNKILFSLLLCGALFLRVSSAPQAVFAQGWVSCMWGPGDVCTSATSHCESEYQPPSDWITQCRTYPTQDACNSARIDCVYDPQEACGGHNEPCCGTIPPLYCDSTFKPTDPQDLTNCICQADDTGAPDTSAPDTSAPGTNTSPIETGLGKIPVTTQGLVSWFLHYSRLIAGGIAFAYLLYGGILFIASQGDEEKVEEAQKTITSALIGLFVIFFATLILRIIGYDILQIPGWDPTGGDLELPQ